MARNPLKISRLTKTSPPMMRLQSMLEKGAITRDLEAREVNSLDDLFKP